MKLFVRNKVLFILVITTFCISGVSVFAITPCENLLENPSFEDGINGWELEDGACCGRGGLYTMEIDETNPKHGNKCLKVIGHKATGTAWHAKVKQRNVSMRKGKKYTISFWARSQGDRPVNISVQKQYDPWTNYLAYEISPVIALSGAEWLEYHYTFTAHEDVDGDMWVGLSIAQHTAVFWIDNFQFYEGLPNTSRVDVNGDGIVNIQDLVMVASNFGKIGAEITNTDVDGNGSINILDLVEVANNIGENVCK